MKNNINIGRWEKTAKAIGFIMSIISALFTIKLMRTFAVDNYDALLFMAFGGTVQFAQVTLLVFAVSFNYIGEQAKAGICMALFGLLMVLSFCGTIGAFTTSNAAQLAQELNGDVRLQELQKRAGSLDRQIENSQDMIASYQVRKYFKNGTIPEGKRLDKLNAERTEISDQIANFKTDGQSDCLYTGLAKLIPLPPEKIKLYLFALYAFALDFVSGVLVAFSIGVLGGQTETGHRQVSGMSENYGPRMTPEPAFQMSGKAPETAHHQNTEAEEKTPVRTGTEVRKQPIGFVKDSDTRKPPGRADLNQKSVKNPGGLVSSDIFREYLNTAYKGKDKPASLMGRRKVADAIGINNDMSDLIHNWLKRKKIVMVDKSRTIPRLTLSEALARVA